MSQRRTRDEILALAFPGVDPAKIKTVTVRFPPSLPSSRCDCMTHEPRTTVAMGCDVICEHCGCNLTAMIPCEACLTRGSDIR